MMSTAIVATISNDHRTLFESCVTVSRLKTGGLRSSDTWVIIFVPSPVRVLFLTHRLPHTPNRGDRVRAFHVVRALRPKVDLEIVSLAHDADELEQAHEMSASGFHVSAFRVPAFRNRLFA